MSYSEAALLNFEDWTGGRNLPTVGTNTGAAVLPFQSWRNFKEAFAPELIEMAVRETPGLVRHIVDPFGGSGTAALAAQFLGVQPTTIEINPYLADLIEAKIGTLDLDQATYELRAVVEDVASRLMAKKPVFAGAPSTFVEPGKDGRWIFSRAVASRILAYRSAIKEVSDPNIQRLFRVSLASTVIPVSNVTISGKGRRYRRGWERIGLVVQHPRLLLLHLRPTLAIGTISRPPAPSGIASRLVGMLQAVPPSVSTPGKSCLSRRGISSAGTGGEKMNPWMALHW